MTKSSRQRVKSRLERKQAHEKQEQSGHRLKRPSDAMPSKIYAERLLDARNAGANQGFQMALEMCGAELQENFSFEKAQVAKLFSNINARLEKVLEARKMYGGPG